MDRPVAHPTSELIYDELGQVLTRPDEAQDWPLLVLVDAPGRLLGVADDIGGGEVGYGVLYDPDTCPAVALPWLAQHRGVRLTGTLTEQQQRDRIRDRPHARRGTVDHVEAAARAHLTGSQMVHLVERTTSTDQHIDRPNRALLQTFTTQTPDPAAVEAAINATDTRPGHVKFEHRVIDGATYGQLAAEFPTVGDFEAEWGTQTNGDVETHLPPEELL